MHILEALWYGNIQPNEQYLKNDSQYNSAIQKVMEMKEQTLSDLSPELQKILENLLDVHLDLEAIADRDAFLFGFRLAMQILFDSLTHSSDITLP